MFRHQLAINPLINLRSLVHENNLELFERIKNDLNHDQIQSLFVQSCIKGVLCIAKELLQSTQDIDQQKAFRNACRNGRLEIAQWLWQLGSIDLHSNEESAFRHACRNGHLELAKWLWQLGGIDIHAMNEYAFVYTCGSRHLEVAQWLWQLDPNVADATSLRSAHDVRTSGISFYKFMGTGERSELSVSELALATQLDPNIDIHVRGEDAFISACSNNNLELAKWLWQIDPTIDIHAGRDSAFAESCISGNFEIAKWLWKLDPIELRVLNHYSLLSYACKKGNLELAQWLWELDPVFYFRGNLNLNLRVKAGI